ncbi:MAG: DMT family transporter [Chlamydiales bacterium]|nr:DMT family transporter [Chlamydiales bacterium]
MNTNIQSGSRSLQNRALLGTLLMILGLALYPLSDALIKHLMGVYTVPQATFLRAITRLIPLFIATFFQGGPLQILKTDHPKRHLFRLSVNLVYTYCFMYAFSLCSLTSIYTLSYSSAFFMIILSALILKETVSKARWAAVAIGMVGVLVAMKPGSNVFEIASCLVLFGTFLGALNKILMRRLASTEHSLAIAIYPNLLMILITFPVLITTWKEMPWDHWGLFAIVGVITAAGQYAIAQALRFAQGSILASIDYSSFFWVVALDFFWWNKTVELHTILGAAIIVLSNLFILYCTRKEDTKKVASAL